MKTSPIDAVTAYVRATHTLNVIVETPRGSRNKYKYDTTQGVFILKKVLPAGAVFPYDFGYVPGTCGEDGDPLDALLLMDEPAFAGCVIQARLIGVIEAEQTEVDGTKERNDRLVAVAIEAHDYYNLKSFKDIDQNLLRELEYFFVSYNQIEGKEFKLIAARGPAQARKLIDQGIAVYTKSTKSRSPKTKR